MNDGFKELENVPVLKFGAEESNEPEGAQELAVSGEIIAAGSSEVAEPLDDSMLTQEEKQTVDAFVTKINLSDSKGILEYGAGTQKKMADFSERTLESVRTKDLKDVGDLLSDVVMEVKGFDQEEESKGLFGLFKKTGNKIAALKANYDKAETNINKIVSALNSHQITLLKDVAMLDRMYNMNLAYYKELTMYVLAGKKKLQEVRAVELSALVDKAKQTGLAEDAQAARDLEEKINRFEKKVYDLDLTRTIAMQTAPQIRMLQNNDAQMAEKIQSTIVNTIPLWKNQMVLALGIEHSAQAAQAQSRVTDATNELLKKNADKLKLATVEAAKINERGVVDMETLKHTNASLISTLDEVIKIQQDGRKKRAEAEVELRALENQLKDKLLESAK